MSFMHMKIIGFCPWFKCISLFSIQLTYCPFFSWLSNLLSARWPVLYPFCLSYALCLRCYFSGLREATHQVSACIHTLCSYHDSDPEKNKHLTSEQHLMSPILLMMCCLGDVGLPLFCVALWYVARFSSCSPRSITEFLTFCSHQPPRVCFPAAAKESRLEKTVCHWSLREFNQRHWETLGRC